MKQEEEIRLYGFIRVHDFDTGKAVYVRTERIVEFFENRVIVRGQRDDFTLEVLESCTEIAELIRSDNPFNTDLPIMPNPYPDPFMPNPYPDPSHPKPKVVTWDPYNPTITTAGGTGNASREIHYDDGR